MTKDVSVSVNSNYFRSMNLKFSFSCGCGRILFDLNSKEGAPMAVMWWPGNEVLIEIIVVEPLTSLILRLQQLTHNYASFLFIEPVSSWTSMNETSLDRPETGFEVPNKPKAIWLHALLFLMKNLVVVCIASPLHFVLLLGVLTEICWMPLHHSRYVAEKNLTTC